MMEILSGDVKEELLNRTKIGTESTVLEQKEAEDIHVFQVPGCWVTPSLKKKCLLKLQMYSIELIVKLSKRSYSQRTAKEEET